ncbi:MAG: hypothetical protein H0X66_09745 [Verrucomicrobia bacterium]|nr:hypothetical protein [Verrucomicrobiota bacterium]
MNRESQVVKKLHYRKIRGFLLRDARNVGWMVSSPLPDHPETVWMVSSPLPDHPETAWMVSSPRPDDLKDSAFGRI